MSSHPSRSREPCVFLSSGHGVLNQVWMIKVLQLELRTFIAGNSKAAEKCSWKKKLLLLLWDLHLLLSSSPAQPEPWDPEKYQALSSSQDLPWGHVPRQDKSLFFPPQQVLQVWGGEMLFFFFFMVERRGAKRTISAPKSTHPLWFSILGIPGKGLKRPDGGGEI